MRTLATGRTLILALLLGGLAAGCGSDRTTGPGPQEPTWEQVRYRETTGGQATAWDISVRSDGTVDGWGNGAPISGLLAGETLETLARIVGDLPPHSYAPSFPCENVSSVVSVERGGEVLLYITGSCDPGAPAALTRLNGFFGGLAAVPRAPEAEFDVLLAGTTSSVREPRRMLIEDRDALVELLREHQSDRPLAMPNVDFRTRFVVAEFLGEQAGSGTQVTIEGVRSEAEWLMVQLLERRPEPGCSGAAGTSRPFVVFSVERAGEHLLIQPEVSAVHCE